MKETIEWFRPKDKLPEKNSQVLIQTNKKSSEGIYRDQFLDRDEFLLYGDQRGNLYAGSDSDCFEKIGNQYKNHEEYIIAWAEMPKGIKI